MNSAGSDPETITRLLGDCADGDRGAFGRLIPLVYDDLREIARRRLASERPEHTLSATAVAHEAYLKLVPQATATWRDRAHFFAVAATVIRQVLVDHARARNTAKRGGGAMRITLDEEMDGRDPDMIEILALEEALTDLARHDPRLEKIVELKYFGGMTTQEAAEALGLSRRTAARDWIRARTYLYRALAKDE